MKVYCPACGSEGQSEIECLAPGTIPDEWECPECGARFRISVQYFTTKEPE